MVFNPIGLIKKLGESILKHLPKFFKPGKKATEKLKKVETKLGDIEGVKDNIQTKPNVEEPSVKDVQEEIKKEEGSESAESKESKKLSEEMNIRAMARAAHSNLLRTLAGNIESTKLALAPEGETEKIVAQLKGKEGEPESALAALSNTGKILSNQVQLGEAIQANNLAVAELAKTTADSDSADLLADRMDQMQADLKSHMDAAQAANMDASAESEAKNKTLMDGIASGMKNSMEFMKSMPDKMDKAAAFKDMLKDVVASYVEEASFIFNGIKMLLEKIPIFKWIKKGLGALTGLIQKHVWPVMKKIGAGIAKLSKAVWEHAIKPIGKAIGFLVKISPPVLMIKGIAAIVKKIANFFGKSKEEKEAEKQAKKEAKEAKKAEKQAKKEAKKNKKGTKESAETVALDKENAELPDQDTLAKEGGVEVGKVDTDGVSEPSDSKDTEIADLSLESGGSENISEEGEIEESEAEGSSAISQYNENEDSDEQSASQEQMLSQERLALQMANGSGGNNTTQNVNIVQQTHDDPSTSYDDYMGG